MTGRRYLIVASMLLCALASRGAEARYPLILKGGRVMDPATGMDSVRDVAIQNGKIAAIFAEPLVGEEVIDVTGKVVAPGDTSGT